MPWKAKSPMDLRKEFIQRLAAGERLIDLCREYGISRKTGSKYKKRHEQLGPRPRGESVFWRTGRPVGAGRSSSAAFSPSWCHS